MKFADFGFKKMVNDGIQELNFTHPTAIQEKIIPLLKKRQSVIGLAYTGTGKTHAFLLPILNNLDLTQPKVQALIIAPTRELARQIYDHVQPFTHLNSQITSGLFIGGNDINRDLEILRKTQPLIVIGTPTRLKELFLQQALKMTTASYVIIDEGDMIFDLGFIEDVDFILQKMDRQVTIGFFSATMNQQLQQHLKKYLQHAHLVNTVQSTPTPKNVRHILIDTQNKELMPTLVRILQSLNPYLCLIFVNQKKEIPLVVQTLRAAKIGMIGELHGDLPPRTRQAMVKRIKNHEFKYVVVTDLAARGLDIENVSDVISLNLPSEPRYYIHRAGRTGRNTAQGISYVLTNWQNKAPIQELKRRGIEFEVMKFKGTDLVLVTNKPKKNKTIVDLESQAVINHYQKKPIKPGYKKKRKAELEQIKKERRRKHIQESIAKIKKAKYQKRRKDIFGDEKK